MRPSDPRAHAAALAVAVLVGAALGTACEPDPGPASGDATSDVADVRPTIACAFGRRTLDDRFVPLGDGAELELVMGFQGFLLVEVAVSVPGDAPGRGTAKLALTVTDQPQNALVQPEVCFTALAAGGWVSDRLVILLNPPVTSQYVDRDAVLSARLELPAGDCVGTTSLRLVDRNPCPQANPEAACP